MPEGIQRYQRTKMVLPLRVWTDEHPGDATCLQLAHTIDISPVGGRLGGLRTELAPGQTILLQRGQHKAAFRVVWSKHLSTHENQAGIEVVETGKNIWGVELPETRNKQAVAETAPAAAKNAPSEIQAVPPIARATVRTARAPRRLIPSVIPRRALWGLSFALFLLSGLLSLSLYREIFSDSNRASIKIPVPAPPTAEDLARMTPKPRTLQPVATASAVPVARVQVAEAPTGHIVYPVSPDEGIGGKVRLQVVIAANGLVKQIHVLSGTQVLAQAAEQAVRLWHYRPFHLEEGPPTERETSVIVSFRGTDAVSLQFPSASGIAQATSN
jgi:TonB family protein